MSITIKPAVAKETAYAFSPKTLYQSTEFYKNGNVYLIVGSGDSAHTLAALRIAGSGEFSYSRDILKSCLEPFEGEIVIKND